MVTAENHTIIGGLGSAVAETMAEAGLGRPLRRVGLRDTFAEGSLTAPYLFGKYGLSTRALIETIWSALGGPGRLPRHRPPPPRAASTRPSDPSSASHAEGMTMSLQEFVPTPRFEDYRESFRDFFTDGAAARTACCSSPRTPWAAPSSSACRTTAPSARC